MENAYLIWIITIFFIDSFSEAFHKILLNIWKRVKNIYLKLYVTVHSG